MPVDKGNQDVTLLYNTQANSREVNKRFQDIRQQGIYRGGRLSVIDASNAQLSPLVCEISDGTYQVKVETTTVVNMAVVEATPYVVLRWTYTGATSDYMEILIVATPLSNDLVVGKSIFGAGVLTGFNYGDVEYPRSTPNTQDLFLKVEPTEDTELKVRIRAGRIQNDSSTIIIPDQKSTLFVPPSSNSRVYLVYVDSSDGTIKIDSSGIVAASPVAPDYAGKTVLAEVTLASTDTNISVDKIVNVRSLVPVSVALDSTSINTNIDGELQVVPALFANSLTIPGYQKILGGLIIQWGTDGASSSSHDYTKNVVFPIPFPNAVFGVWGTPRSGEGSNNAVRVPDKTKIGFTLYNGDYGPVTWMALGK